MISGAKARRPGLDQMMKDARRGKFDVVLVWASDRIARSVRHFLDVLDELNRLQIEFISFREQIDTGGPLGRAIVVIIGAIAELERSLCQSLRKIAKAHLISPATVQRVLRESTLDRSA